MDNEYETQVVLQISGAQVFEIKGKQQKLIHNGDLLVMEVEKLNLTFLKLDQFQYTLGKNIPVMTQGSSQAQKMYIFPCVDQMYFGVVLNRAPVEMIQVFEFILSNKCHFVQPSGEHPQYLNQNGPMNGVQNYVQEKVDIMSQEMMMTSQIIKVQVPPPGQYGSWDSVGQGAPQVSSTAGSISGMIIKGGDLIKGGVIYGAGILSQGVQYGGQVIKSKISPDEKPTQVDQATVNKVKLASAGSGAMLMYTKTQVDALVKMGIIVGEEASKQIGQSDTGLKLQSHENYTDAKTIGKATIYAFFTVYDGLYCAIAQLASTLASTSTEVINHKYGQQAGDLSKNTFEIAGNVGQLTYVYKDAAAQALIQETKPTAQIHVPQAQLNPQQQHWGQ